MDFGGKVSECFNAVGRVFVCFFLIFGLSGNVLCLNAQELPLLIRKEGGVHGRVVLADLKEPARINIVDGRLLGQKAVLVEEGRVRWELDNIRSDYSIEFWIKPVNWDGMSDAEVDICRFSIGREDFVLLKPSGLNQLHLLNRGRVLEAYPAYNWFKQARPEKDDRYLWHYVNLAVEGTTLNLTIDGFAGRRIRNVRALGGLHGIEYAGSPGTVFSWPLISRGVALSGKDLYTRFSQLFVGEPDIRRNVITLPYMSEAPEVDGKFREEEWQEAARITGFGTIAQNELLVEEVEAYIGYDSENLYLAVITPYKGELEARKWGIRDKPIWREESYEIFIAPPDVKEKDVIQLVGNPYGDQADYRYGSGDWKGEWQWEGEIFENKWMGELKACFSGIEAHFPGEGEVWNFNMFNTKANIAWSPARGSYRNIADMGNIRFDSGAPAIRPGIFRAGESFITVPFEIIGGRESQVLTIGIELYGVYGGFPIRQNRRELFIDPGEKATIEMAVSIEDYPSGSVGLYVDDGNSVLFYHSVRYPAARGRR